MTEPTIQYQLGQLAGQMAALAQSNQTLIDALSRLELRFEAAINAVEKRVATDIEELKKANSDMSKTTTNLRIKMAGIGATGGAFGGVAMMVLQHLFFNK